jgi:phosphate transport system protein
MPIHLQREIDRVKRDLLLLGSMVEDQVATAIRALLDRNPELARKVELGDQDVDRREIELEEECLKTLALHQPVAADLRLLITALKINNDLERVGDLAVNIARKAGAYAAEPRVDAPFDVAAMWEETQSMLRDSLDSLVNMDAALAQTVRERDDEVDRMKRESRMAVEARIRRQPEQLGGLLRLLAIARNLERIADCATSIAEDVIYMVEGRIVRHAAGTSEE